jgi:hypothetical protein
MLEFSAFATGSVTLVWAACTDPCVVGYNVYYGSASGAYTNEITLGNSTNTTISGLVEGNTYYFAATTYSASGKESPFSTEVPALIPLNVPLTNRAPTLNAITNLVINENAGLQTVSLSGITAGATNENQTLTVTAISSNAGLIPTPTVYYTNANTTGTLTFAPATDSYGTATITVTVNDGSASNNIVTRSFTVTVNAVNNQPTLNAIANLVINENAGLQTVNLSGITSGAANESQTLTVSAVSSNPGLIPNPTAYYTNANTTGRLTFTPVTNSSGVATITVTVKDNGTSNNIVTRNFTVTVNAVNNQPTLNTITNLVINENAGLQTVKLSGITAGATNESQTLTVTAVSSNTGLIPNPTVNYTNANPTGNLTFAPVTNSYGSATITVTVNDGGASNNTVSRTFTVTVNGVNNPPTLDAITNLVVNENSGPQTVNLSGITSGAANESQTLTITASSSKTNLIRNPTVSYTSPNPTGSLTITPVTNANGTATITVTVKDGGTSNNVVTRTFTVTVNAVNQPPTLTAISNLTTNENPGLQTVKLSGISPGATNESQTLTITAISSNPALIPNPTVYYTNANSTGRLTFVPATNSYGTADITVTINDGCASNNLVTRTFTVTIYAMNQKPTLNSLSNLSIPRSAGMQTVNLSGITSGAPNENQGLTVTATSSYQTLIPIPTVNYTSPDSTGTLTFTPVASRTGSATITVTVRDSGTSNNVITRTFTVTVSSTTTTTSSSKRPALSCQLTNQAALAGQSKTFVIKATGSGTLKYQWKFNGTALATTSSTLTLSNVKTNQSGVYTVTVTDRNGSTNSAAQLKVYASAAAKLAPAAHAAGQYSLTVDEVPGCRYVVQASTDFVNWVPVLTNTAPFTYVDTNAGQFGQRFYRSVYAP